jgi:hypothetical protein
MLSQSKSSLEEKLEQIREHLETEHPYPIILEEEIKAFKYYQETLKTKEEYWRLKSISLWLQVGDKNTKFFHRQTKAILWRNRVTEISNVDGEMISYFEQIKKATSQHFEGLYKENLNLSLDSFERMLEPIPSLLNSEDNEQLCKLIS